MKRDKNWKIRKSEGKKVNKAKRSRGERVANDELATKLLKPFLQFMETTGLLREIEEGGLGWQTKLEKGWSFGGQKNYAREATEIFANRWGSPWIYTREELALRVVHSILSLEVFKTQMRRAGMIPPIECTRRAIRRVLSAYQDQMQKVIAGECYEAFGGNPALNFVYILAFKAVVEFVRPPKKAAEVNGYREEISMFWERDCKESVAYDPERASHNGYQVAKKGNSEVVV